MKEKLFILFRYFILLLLVIFSLPFLYTILTPLTIYPYLYLLKLFFNNISLSQNTIIINFQTIIEIIPACIAASAYLLLLILNLTTPIQLKKRIQALLFSLTSLLLINILRITFFSILAYNSLPLFNLTHKLSWYFLSTLFVVGIWFLTIKLFKIKTIPIYSDIKELTNPN